MAEILLSLTIIGVVAAITLPSLTGNINERTWNTQRKALYARISQAVALMPSLNGYGILKEEAVDEDGNITQSAVDTAAETFLTEGLSKVLKINNICDAEHLADCGMPKKFTNVSGSVDDSFPTTLFELNSAFGNGSYQYWGATHVYSIPNIKAAAFETLNGESIAVYYNPRCVTQAPPVLISFAQSQMCANFVYDLNGAKGPNTMGKDMGFITVLYATDPLVLAPIVYYKDAGVSSGGINGDAICKRQNSENKIPSIEELIAMFINRKFIGIYTGGYVAGTNSNIFGRTDCWFWYIDFANGSRDARGYGSRIRCVKARN